MPPLFPEDASSKSEELVHYSTKPQQHLSVSENSFQSHSLLTDYHLSCGVPSSVSSPSTTCTALEDEACRLSIGMTDEEDETSGDNDELPQPAQPPMSVTPQQLLEGLEESFLEMVLVDARPQPVTVLTGAVCVEALEHLIESHMIPPSLDPGSPFMASNNPFSTFASERLNNANVSLQMFDGRLQASHVVVYDDEGEVGGQADRVARALRQSGRCLSSRHLEGGLKAWVHKFGNALMDPAAWAVRDGITEEEEPHVEIQELRARQAKLVQGVWHTKPIPWSVYTGQSGEEFVDESRRETMKPLDEQHEPNIQSNPSDGTLLSSSTAEDDCVQTLLSAATTGVTPNEGFAELIPAASLSSPLCPIQIVPSQDYPHEILPNLYLGGETTALEDRLRAFNIRQVVRIGWFWTPLVDGIRYYGYCLLDEIAAAESIRRVIPQAIEAIACALATGESVLVHCQAGVSRSATVVLAYLMRYHSLTFRQAWDLVFRIRPIVRPNKGFAQVLLRYEEQLKAEGIISTFPVLSSTFRFPKNTDSQVPIPLYWVCESFDHYREYLEVEIRLRQIRQQLEAAKSDVASNNSPAETVSVTSSSQSPSSTLSCPSPPPIELPDQDSTKLVTQPERMNALSVIVREE